MAYTFGSTALKIIPESYSPIHSPNGLVEISILPDGTTNPATIIQQGGRGRKTVSFQGFTTSYSDYKTLHADYVALTSRSFTDGADTLTMIISDLSPAVMIATGKWEYSITLMEA